MDRGQAVRLHAGLNYNIFRWYRAGVALSGSQLYAYVGGNPLLYKDPFGLVSIKRGFQKLGTVSSFDNPILRGLGGTSSLSLCSCFGQVWSRLVHPIVSNVTRTAHYRMSANSLLGPSTTAQYSYGHDASGSITSILDFRPVRIG